MSNVSIENLSTCETYGISGNCGSKCPKFNDKTCEVYSDTLERLYNQLQQENQQLKNQLNQIKNNNEELKRRIKSIQEKRDSYKFRYKDVCKKLQSQKQLKQKDKLINEMLDFPIFTSNCPYEQIDNDGGKILLICDCKNCKDNYKECWLKYFKNKIGEK